MSALGCEDLLTLCDRVPIHRFSWTMEPQPWATLIERQGKLRAALWRRHCVAARAPGIPKCIDEGLACRSPANCLADRWLPLPAGSGGSAWRMASLFVRAHPPSKELVLWAVGELGRDERSSLTAAMRPWIGERAYTHQSANLSDFSPKTPGAYRMALVTPWVLEKLAPHRQPRAVDDFAARLRTSIERRMQKFASLALRHATQSVPEEVERLIGFTARYVAQQLLPTALRVESLQITVSAFGIPSGSTQRLVPHVVADANGSLVLQIDRMALPWVGLLTIAGGGESADKGFGGILLSPL